MRRVLSLMIVASTCLFFGCATQSADYRAEFNPQADGAVILFGKACVELYPKNDGSLEKWLARPGIEEVKRSDRSAGSTLSSVEYSIHSVSKYSLVYEKINLCTVRVSEVDSESMTASLSAFRAGFVKSGLKETASRRESYLRVNDSYEYRKNGDFVLRIDHSAERNGSTLLTAVSSLRSDNL